MINRGFIKGLGNVSAWVVALLIIYVMAVGAATFGGLVGSRERQSTPG